MENEKRERSHIKIVVIVFFVALFCAIGAVLALNWNNWFGGSGKPQMSLSDVASGTYIVNINDESHTYNAKYIIDGVEVKVPAGEYVSDQKDEVVFLVVNGGSLIVDGATLKKNGDEFYAGEEKYSVFGENSLVVVAGKDSSASFSNADISINASGANAFMVFDGGHIDTENNKISISNGYSSGFVAGKSSEITVKNNSISIKEKEGGASIVGSKAFATVDASSKIDVSGGSVESYANFIAPAIYAGGEVTINGSLISVESSPLAMLGGSGRIVLNGGEYTTKSPAEYAISQDANYPFNYSKGFGQMFSASVIFMGGTPSFVSNNAKLTQESYSMPSSESDSKWLAAYFVADNAKANIELNDTTVMMNDSSSLKFVGAVNSGAINISAPDLKINRAKDYSADDSSSVTGL